MYFQELFNKLSCEYSKVYDNLVLGGGVSISILQLRTTDATPNSICDANIAYALTTSGTTGSPKIVKVPHSCIVSNVLDLRYKTVLGTNCLCLFFVSVSVLATLDISRNELSKIQVIYLLSALVSQSDGSLQLGSVILWLERGLALPQKWRSWLCINHSVR